MFKRILAGLVLACTVFSAHATVITISDYYLLWVSGNPESGGVGKMSYRESNNALKQFEVNIAPFAQSLNTINHGTEDWLTPMAGSDYSFDPVQLYGIWAEDIIFTTSMGLGFATWENNQLFKVNFPDGYASWNITLRDPQVSTVPEPGSLALLGLGLLGITASQKRKKVGIATRRMLQVGNHLGTMTKNKPSGNRGFIICIIVTL